MILQLFEIMGLNPYLVFDFVFIGFIITLIGMVFILNMFKGMVFPMLKATLYKKNLAFVDMGGIETEILTYSRGSEALEVEHKDDTYNWSIPIGIERLLPNKMRFILASKRLGVCFNSDILAQELRDIKKLMNPKIIANTIDDRSKSIADQLTKDMNKPILYAGVIGGLFLICIFGFLAFQKGLEYDACKHITDFAKTVTSTTIQNLPPLD